MDGATANSTHAREPWIGVTVRSAAVAATCLLAGCHQFDEHRFEIQSYAATGRYEQAASVLDDPRAQKLYGPKSALLWKLDRGAVALALDDTARTMELLEDAERQIEVQREAAAGDVLAKWTINDASASYIVEPYEDIYVNVLKLLAQLESGNIQGGATVEARRLASKTTMLREQYVKYEDEMRSQGGSRRPKEGAGGAGGGVVAVNKAGEFIESPLGTYLAAMAFMEAGEPEFQEVAGRRLLSTIELQEGLIGPVRLEDFEGLDSLRADEVNVLVVALSGRGPTKYAERVGPIPLGTLPVYFELPKLQVFPSEAASAVAEVRAASDMPAGSEAPQAEPTVIRELILVESLSSVAAENHRRLLPLIYTRTYLRYALKAGISVALTEAARHQAADNDQGAVQLAGVLAGLLFLGTTERADLRCWTFLPGEARVGTLDLPPGEHEIRTVYKAPDGGTLYAGPWRRVSVPADGLATLVEHFWR